MGGQRFASVHYNVNTGAGGAFYYTRDRLGSVVAVSSAYASNTTPQIVGYRYTPYGDLELTAGTEQDTLNSDIGYTGALKLSEGVLHLGSRDYWPFVRGWLQPDSLDVRRYTYVGGDPANSVDPTGMIPYSYDDRDQNAQKEYQDSRLEQEGIYVFNGVRLPEPSSREEAPATEEPKPPEPTPPESDAPSLDPVVAATYQGNVPLRSPGKGQQPGSTLVIPGSKGRTVRTFGDDGKAVVDLDSGHDHGPGGNRAGKPKEGPSAGDPHAHDWDHSKADPRGAGRPLTPEEQKQLDALKAVGAVGAGYIIYRAVRLLPSLAPPLWPSLPANIVIP
jgi:RHS repeat-associated protein